MSSSFLMHAIRKETQSLKVEACLPKTERTGNHIAWSSWSKILSVTFDGDTLLRQLMRRNRSFTATNVTHRPESLRARACSLFPSCPLFFFPPCDEEEERKHGTVQGRSCNEVMAFGEFWRGLEKLEMSSFSTYLPQFIGKWMSSSPPMRALETLWLLKSRPTTREDRPIEEMGN